MVFAPVGDDGGEPVRVDYVRFRGPAPGVVRDVGLRGRGAAAGCVGGGAGCCTRLPLALGLAARGEGEAGPLPGGPFDAPGGGGAAPIASWEDAPAVAD